jgi:hypothetical protein
MLPSGCWTGVAVTLTSTRPALPIVVMGAIETVVVEDWREELVVVARFAPPQATNNKDMPSRVARSFM